MKIVGILVVSVAALACRRANDADRSPVTPAVDQSPCYALKLGTWSLPFPSGVPAEHIPPDSIRLDTAAMDKGWMKLHPRIATTRHRRSYFPPRWRRVGVDSLELMWSNGYSGIGMRLMQRGDSLVGTAHARYDVVGPPVPVAPVTGKRIACSQLPLTE